jgi:hypothetical protein
MILENQDYGYADYRPQLKQSGPTALVLAALRRPVECGQKSPCIAGEGKMAKIDRERLGGNLTPQGRSAPRSVARARSSPQPGACRAFDLVNDIRAL